MAASPASNDNDADALLRAIEKANPNVLRLALYHATRDPELARMRVGSTPFWGGAFFVPTLAEEHVARVREKALAFMRGGGMQTAPSPTEAELREMMNLLSHKHVSDFAYSIGRGDLVEEEFPLGVQWNKEPPPETKRAYHVVVIGAGMAGLSSSIQLKRLGIPHTVIERNSDVGGTWWANNYPEARVDIASHHYQYSFMKHYRWRHYFATREELKDYAGAVAQKYDLRRNIRFRTEATKAVWDEASQKWHVTVRSLDGKQETLTANVVVSAAGLFNAINMPDIPGIESYRGTMFHSNQWDHSFEYAGKRIAQIGVGSTGAQLMPEIARRASHLTVYQRSPQWVSAIAGYRDPVSDEDQWLFDHFPHYWGWYSCFIFMVNMGGDPEGLQNLDPEWKKAGGLVSERNDNLRKHNIEYMRSKIGHRPELLEKLIPDFPPFAKRPVVDNGWFDALNRDNVELVTDAIERITPRGILTRDGIEREFDGILLCAGFKTERYLWPVQYHGRNGITLEEAWKKDGPRSYLGITVSGFPNLFIVYGPNGQARSGGLIKWLEIWTRYALLSIVEMIENGHRSMEIRRDVFDDYNAKSDKALEKCIWSDAKSYYVNDQGRQTVNMPWKPAEYYEWVRKPDLGEYETR